MNKYMFYYVLLENILALSLYHMLLGYSNCESFKLEYERSALSVSFSSRAEVCNYACIIPLRISFNLSTSCFNVMETCCGYEYGWTR